MPTSLLRLLPALLLITPVAAAPAATATIPTREQLVARFGPPTQVVAPNLWIFWHPVRISTRARDAGFDTLIARVEDGRIVHVRWVNGEDLRALLARHAPGALLQAPLEVVPAEPPPAG